jgi:hypothetical protein
MQGWIKLHRQILENPISKKPNYLALWIILILKSNHEPNTFIWNKKKQVCNRGQLLTGRNQLSIESGISSGTIENILNYLESEHQIEQQKTSKFRLITIKNYNKYQEGKQEIEQQNDNRMTTELQQNDTNKNDKNEKNENKPFGETNSPVWNYSDYLKNLIESKRRDYNIIGRYFRFRGLVFPTKDAANAELKRFLVDAKTLKDYKDEDIAKVAEWTKNKYTPDKWNLGTIAKIIPNYLANKNQNGN